MPRAVLIFVSLGFTCTLARQRPAAGPPVPGAGRLDPWRGLRGRSDPEMPRWELVSIACCAIALADCVRERAHLPWLRLHDLRHACATFLLGPGVDPRTVLEILGDTTIRQTMDRYGHALPERVRAAADVMDQALGRPRLAAQLAALAGTEAREEVRT